MLGLTVCGIWSVIIIFAACEIGERGIALFEKMENEINQFEWYLFPLRIQRMLPTILIVAQEQAIINCFGSIACTRQCFKEVC